MKTNINLTWSKIIAVIILLIGTVFAFLNYSSNVEKSAEILTTAMLLCAGLLGWRQAATALKGMGTKNEEPTGEK